MPAYLRNSSLFLDEWKKITCHVNILNTDLCINTLSTLSKDSIVIVHSRCLYNIRFYIICGLASCYEVFYKVIIGQRR